MKEIMRIKFRKVKTLAMVAMVMGSMTVQEVVAQPDWKSREEVPAEYKWNFNDIFTSWEEWESALKECETLMGDIAAMQGQIANNSVNFVKLMKMEEKLGMMAGRVYQYPNFMNVVDSRNQEINARLQQVGIMFARYGQSVAWITPELLTVPEATMMQWIDENPELEAYRFGMKDMYRQQKHVLSADKEQLLSMFNQISGNPSSVYDALSTTDIEFPEVTLSDGSKVTMTPGTYSHLLSTSKNQADRKLAYESHYGVYDANKNAYAAIYNGICQADWAGSQSRNYSSSLEAALEGNSIPVEVYTNLIKTAKENVAPLHRYIALRKKALGLDEYHRYDGSVSLTDYEKSYNFEEGKELVRSALKPMGKDYMERIDKALAAGWIDVYENPGKSSGAFSSNVYGVHPFIMLNYNNTQDYVYTLAHELGHSMHSMYSSEFQPFATSHYTIFVGEVASTYNERMLLDYMLDHSKDPKERIALLTQAIEGIMSTFYVQIMFADFEYQAHTMVEQGQPINSAILNKVMGDLSATYFGDAVTRDEMYDVTWARISHFFGMPYYVYQYATSFSASSKIYNDIHNGSKKERKAAQARYFELLKSGGNDYPINQLKKAGVNMTQPDAVMAVINRMDELVSMLEKELDALK